MLRTEIDNLKEKLSSDGLAALLRIEEEIRCLTHESVTELKKYKENEAKMIEKHKRELRDKVVIIAYLEDRDDRCC